MMSPIKVEQFPSWETIWNNAYSDLLSLKKPETFVNTYAASNINEEDVDKDMQFLRPYSVDATTAVHLSPLVKAHIHKDLVRIVSITFPNIFVLGTEIDRLSSKIPELGRRREYTKYALSEDYSTLFYSACRSVGGFRSYGKIPLTTIPIGKIIYPFNRKIFDLILGYAKKAERFT